MDLLQNCSDCYQFTLSQFPATITIIEAIAPSTPFYIWITDKFGNVYCTDAITTDSSGTLIIDETQMETFPTGWFCKDAGSFKIEAKPIAPYYSETTTFTFNEVAYDCIWVDFAFNNAPKTAIV